MDTPVDPLVSVVIPTHKRLKTLERAIESVVGQTYKNIELIVVDDNDADSAVRGDVERLIRRYSGSAQVCYVQHEKNKGGAAARNTGIRQAKGAYVAFLDDDDEFLPRKIEAQVARLTKAPKEVAAVYCKAAFSIGNEKYAETTKVMTGNLQERLLAGGPAILGGSTLLIRRDALLELGGFDERFDHHQDVEILIRYFDTYLIDAVDEVLVTIHKDSGNGADARSLTAAKDRLYALSAERIDALGATARRRIVRKNSIEVANAWMREGDPGAAIRVLLRTEGITPGDFWRVFAVVPLKRVMRRIGVVRRLRATLDGSINGRSRQK